MERTGSRTAKRPAPHGPHYQPTVGGHTAAPAAINISFFARSFSRVDPGRVRPPDDCSSQNTVSANDRPPQGVRGGGEGGESGAGADAPSGRQGRQYRYNTGTQHTLSE